MMAGYNRTHLAAATAAVANRFFASANMANGAYAVANSGTMPSEGARHITCCRTVAGNADTPGTITFVAVDLTGATVSETVAVGANGVTVATVGWYVKVVSQTQAGWVIDPGTTTNDTIVIGCGAEVICAQAGTGVLRRVVVNTTAAGAVTISDANSTIAVLKASVAEQHFDFDVNFFGYLQVALAAASDITIVHTPSWPE